MDGSQDGVGYQMVSTQRERPTAVAHNLLVLFRDILACHGRVVQVGSNIANIGHLRMRSCSSHMCSDSLTWSRENGISPVTLFMGLRRTDSVLIWRGPNLVPGLQRNSGVMSRLRPPDGRNHLLDVAVSKGMPTKQTSSPSAVSCIGSLMKEAIPAGLGRSF